MTAGIVLDHEWLRNDKDSVGFTPIYRLGKRDAFLRGKWTQTEKFWELWKITRKGMTSIEGANIRA